MKSKVIIFILLITLLSGCNLGASESAVDKVKELVSTYQEKSGISAKATDVEFDMANRLDDPFVIAGTASLSDYYNYGYEFFEDKWFSVRLDTIDRPGSWYLYFDRKSDKALFEELKNNNKVILVAAAFVPKSIYNEKQGKMAAATTPVWVAID
ncbi:MAG: hypothetical protein IKE29_12470 [Paenibacillus sp.]|uniref:hypothetical protein n=1 Tax=Paenibacillus sp. TaxID=58172 RepID=UPI0025D3A63F|nr:hypothetical protein [Paenibacillus sp.]MBR2565426.1 hypothetical protein [Paenibacillus sp.]